MTSKIVDLREAVTSVTDGSHLALGGFAITRNAVAVAHELVRAGRRDLNVTQVIGGIETDLLAAGDCIGKLTYSGGSLDRFGPLHNVNRGIGDGRIEALEYSSLALTLRLLAGSLGLPSITTHSMLGSDLLEPLIREGEAVVDVDPFGGGRVVVMPALRPDIAFVHVDVADDAGNAAVDGPRWALRETALAAPRVVVIAEERVATGEIDANRVALPAAVVDAVVVLPRGAHPTAVHERYDFDRQHLTEYAQSMSSGADERDAYLDRFVRGVDTHAAYLALVGAA